MNKKIIIILIVFFCIKNDLFATLYNLPRFYTIEMFQDGIKQAKDDIEKQKQIYISYIHEFYIQRNFDDTINLIDEFSAKYPDSEYVDDFQWLKGEMCKYHLHKYKDYLDISLNLIEKYGGVKFDYKLRKESKQEWFPEELKKEDLEKDLKEVKGFLSGKEKIKEEIRGNRDDENKIIEKYLELGRMWRRYYDFENAEKTYLEGVKELANNERASELLYEMGEMYRWNNKDISGYIELPINYEMKFRKSYLIRDIKNSETHLIRNIDYKSEVKKENSNETVKIDYSWWNFDYTNENNKKALKYYLEVYSKYPKSKIALKALENAGDLYSTIGWEWINGMDKYIDVPIHYLTRPDYAKSAELYEKIWKEYPEYENIGKIRGAYLGALQRSGKISEIEYLKKKLEIGNLTLRDRKNIEKFLEKAERYKELYNEYPKIGLSPHEPEYTINQIEELIKKKQIENEKSGGEK